MTSKVPNYNPHDPHVQFFNCCTCCNAPCSAKVAVAVEAPPPQKARPMQKVAKPHPYLPPRPWIRPRPWVRPHRPAPAPSMRPRPHRTTRTRSVAARLVVFFQRGLGVRHQGTRCLPRSRPAGDVGPLQMGGQIFRFFSLFSKGGTRFSPGRLDW